MIKKFDELKLFNVTTLSEAAFYNCSSLRSIALDNITSIGRTAFRYAGLYYAWLPKIRTLTFSGSAANGHFANTRSLIALRLDSVTSIAGVFYSSTIQYIVCTVPTVPTGTTSSAFPSIVYVLDSLVSEYQASSEWSLRSIRPLSQLPNDYPNCPWLDDLRENGFIE